VEQPIHFFILSETVPGFEKRRCKDAVALPLGESAMVGRERPRSAVWSYLFQTGNSIFESPLEIKL
jgi:hypothetical protein